MSKQPKKVVVKLEPKVATGSNDTASAPAVTTNTASATTDTASVTAAAAAPAKRVFAPNVGIKREKKEQ